MDPVPERGAGPYLCRHTLSGDLRITGGRSDHLYRRLEKSMNAVVTALKEVDDQTAEMLRGIIRSLFEIAKVKVREELVPVKRPRHRFKNKKKEEKGEVPRHTPAASPDATVTQGSAARHAPKLRGSHRQGRPG